MKHVAVNERGRRVGETHPRAKLTDHEVDLIRELAEGELQRNPKSGRWERVGAMSYAEIAKKFEVAKDTVESIVLCRRRAHIAIRLKRVK